MRGITFRGGRRRRRGREGASLQHARHGGGSEELVVAVHLADHGRRGRAEAQGVDGADAAAAVVL